MWLHNIEGSGYQFIGTIEFDNKYNVMRNNAELEKVWEILKIMSKDSLSHEFSELYYHSGAWSPAYDLNSKNEGYPPSATFGGLELLLPTYKSTHYKSIRPVVLGIYAHKEDEKAAWKFIQDFEKIFRHVGEGEVYAVMQRENDKPLVSHYANAHDFRAQYLDVMNKKKGKVVLVTNKPEDALNAFRREYAGYLAQKIDTEDVSGLFQYAPKFINRVLLRPVVNQQYPTIESVFTS